MVFPVTVQGPLKTSIVPALEGAIGDRPRVFVIGSDQVDCLLADVLMERIAGLLELCLETRERGAVECRGAIDRHPAQVQDVSVQVDIGVPRVDDRVRDARGIVLRVEEAGWTPAGLLHRIGALMSNLIVKSSSTIWRLV